MFTTVDKALVAVAMGVIYLITYFTGLDFGAREETVAAVISFLTPVLVYLVPNKKTPAEVVGANLYNRGTPV